MPDKLLIYSKQAKQYSDLIYEKLPKLKQVSTTTKQEAKQHLDCNILLAEPNLATEIINEMPKLEWLQSTWAGITPLLHKSLQRNYLLTGVKGIFGPLMSEYVFAFLLSFERQLPDYLTSQQKQQWQPLEPSSLVGKTLGIMGTGSIGSHIAKTAKQFGLITKGYSQSGNSVEGFDKTYPSKQLHSFLKNSHYLVNSLPDTPETTELLNAKAFKQLQNCIFINVGRGSIINESALIQALKTKHVKAAVLDVFKQEPLEKTHPFWTTANLFMTPHIAAPSFPKSISSIFIKNYQKWQAKETLEFLIDFKKGY